MLSVTHIYVSIISTLEQFRLTHKITLAATQTLDYTHNEFCYSSMHQLTSYEGKTVTITPHYLKRIPLLSVLLLAAITLAACTPPNPEPDQILLNDTTTTTGQQDTNTTSGQNQQQTSTSNSYALQQAAQQVLPGGKKMKTLQDFQPIEGNYVTLVTSKGEIKLELYRDKAPLTTLNFLTLAKEGFYDGIVFHRVIEDFMAQVGDPLTKDPSKQAQWGTGGPGYAIEDEFHPDLKHDSAGVLSMANSGPNSGGSQVFITFEATPWLDGKHAVFGKVVEGMEVLNSITQGDTIVSTKIE